MEFEKLTGPEKAAVLVLSLPAQRARELLLRLGDDEVERILSAVSRFEEVPPAIHERVKNEFLQLAQHDQHAITGGRGRALELCDVALEDPRRGRIKEQLDRDDPRIDWTLRAFDESFIADALSEEHPQTIALILSQLPASRGASVIAALSDDFRAEVVVRLADLDSVAPDVISELEEGVSEMFGKRLEATMRVGGRDAAAQLLNRIGSESGESILAIVNRSHADLADQIRKRMLTFNDLLAVDDRGFQLLLREVQTEELVIALKAASDEMREKVFKNISARAADQIREDLEMLPPMKLSDVEAAQERVVEIARGMADEETIRLPIGDSEDVLV